MQILYDINVKEISAILKGIFLFKLELSVWITTNLRGGTFEGFFLIF